MSTGSDGSIAWFALSIIAIYELQRRYSKSSTSKTPRRTLRSRGLSVLKINNNDNDTTPSGVIGSKVPSERSYPSFDNLLNAAATDNNNDNGSEVGSTTSRCVSVVVSVVVSVSVSVSVVLVLC